MSDDLSVPLFQRAAKEVPAYRHFLNSHNIEPAAIKSASDFSSVPLTSKKNYLQKYPFKELIWPAVASDLILFCATSGSTGEPYYFPRSDKLAWQYSVMLEDYLKSSSYGSGGTLVIIGFGMGVWIGGVFTQRAFEIAGTRMKQPLALLPAGYNKTEIFKALAKLAPQFDQTVIVGYPPFIKELVDEAPAENINLKKLQVRFLFAAEAFSETFRNYLCDKAGVADPIRDTLNIYGTADIGAMAYETPLSILIRRLAIKDPLLCKDLFGQIEKTPTLAQYNPEFISFEEVKGEVVLTGDSAIPLIRYAVGDHGGVLTYQHIKQLLNRYDINIDAEIQKAGIDRFVNRQHPFVFVYERTNMAVTLHGLIIYPEFIKEGLLQTETAKHFTERFTMATKNDAHHNQFIQINVELQKGVEPSSSLENTALKYIRESLIKRSSEFAEVSRSHSADKLIQVVLWPNGHPRYFAPGTKQKWAEK